MRLKLRDTSLYLLMRALKAFDRRKTAMRHFDPSSVRSILLVSSTALGDTLLSTPAIRAVRKSYPGARITALLNRDNMELFRNNPYIDSIVPYRSGYRRFFSFAKELKRYSFDLAVVLHGNEPETTPLCYLSGADFIVKLPNTSGFNFLLSNRDPVLAWGDLGHGIRARLRTAGLAGVRPDGERMDVFIEREDEERVERFLEREGAGEGSLLIGFHPGASTLSRQWFPERFMELGERVSREFPGARVVLTGSPSEKALCERIAAGISGSINTAGSLGLRELPPLIKRLSVFVTGDTGPMHIAYALSTSVVALYAVSDPEKTGPLYDWDRHRVIKKERTCEPCVSKKCAYQKCMEQISVGEVLVAVKELVLTARKENVNPKC